LHGRQEHITIIHMVAPSRQSRDIVLASASPTRAQLLRAAGLAISVVAARIDEEAMRMSMSAGGASPRDIADALGEAKARKIAGRFPDAIVIGCDRSWTLPVRPGPGRKPLMQRGHSCRRFAVRLTCFIPPPCYMTGAGRFGGMSGRHG
jgi:hypothetical protein